MQNEQYRPKFHFSPEENWLNDPNGLCYLDGEYHLFYQHHPHSKVWGPMHWGHAVSRDLLHWEHLPIALFPDDNGQIFSGSMVVDEHNTSGLQIDDQKVMVAIFTYHSDKQETQGIAYSRDQGRTWEKYAKPVLDNPGLKDFRDPKVFWHQDHWIMSLACGDHIRFYKSDNLLDWSYLSSFGEKLGAHGGVWECPDLIPFDDKWVLIVSINPGGPNGGSAIQYFTGDFDGEVFRCDHEGETKWADYGRDFYAAVTWSGLDKPFWIGWMNNWQYANEVPTDPFRGTMSIPRRLSLENGMLVQQPVEVDSLVEESVQQSRVLAEQESFTEEVPRQVQVKMAVSSEDAHFSCVLKSDNGELVIQFSPERVVVDRRNAGDIGFSDKFPSVDAMPCSSIEQLQLLIDDSSIELFINGGKYVMTELFYMEGESFEMKWINKGLEQLELEMVTERIGAMQPSGVK
ncbi:glycoside hydrolase family 32 protein [Jeotgalibacillus malaysiensis]|uniref:glycoside hydrolase family 32 protein n=1 Tax=Jeotgalibacillus malaysiensis TaxID=1508404 RepID=UPI00384C1A1B